MILHIFADTAGNIVSSSIAPAITALALMGSALCVLFIIIGGYQYMSSGGSPERLMRAKKIIKNALIGLVIVIGAALLSHFLSSAYGPVAPNSNSSVVPNLSPIKPSSSSSGIITVIIKAITGVLGSIIETVGTPFLKALSYFTTGTPLAATNHAVFDLWVGAVGMADALMVLAIVLIGLHTMGYVSLGLEQIDIRHILPQAALVFALINSSIFIIDSVISLSNVLIKAITGGNNAAQSVWQTLETVIKQPSTYSLGALIIMSIFLVFSVILLIYYVGRIVTIYLGAILAPLVILCWLLPSLRDVAVAASKRYFSAIFVLFIHVVILELSASLLIGMTSTQNPSPDPLMAMIVGLATLVALLKTQGVMSQLSYATIGPRMTRKIAQRLILNTSYLGSQAASSIASFIPISGIGKSINVPGRDYSYRQPPFSSSVSADPPKTQPTAPSATSKPTRPTKPKDSPRP